MKGAFGNEGALRFSRVVNDHLCFKCQRKFNRKGAAGPACRLAINFPAMFIDDLQRVGEPKSGAIALGREKRHKQIASLLLGHAVAVVADAD